jgi:hypothetical protein
MRNLEKISSLSPEQRGQQEPFVFARELVTDQEAFCEVVVPHVLSYLPDGTDLSTTVHLTALDHPHTGVTHGKYIVLALSHPMYHYAELLFDQGSASVSNILAHELFHRGYNENWFLRAEHGLENGPLQDLINELQNEGMATYVAYELRSLYPSSLDPVYLRLESELWIRTLIARLNRLFEMSETMDSGKLMEKVVQFSDHQQNAYIVGAFMAQTIEEHLGRETLVATVAEGPISFIRTYNTVAQDGMRLAFQPTPPTDSSVYLQLREATLAGDDGTVEALLSTIEDTAIVPSGYEAYTLYTTGHLLRHQGHTDAAIRVFQRHVAFFPEDASGYLGLGQCYQAIGEDDLARVAFEEGLRLDARAVWAAIVLEGLR